VGREEAKSRAILRAWRVLRGVTPASSVPSSAARPWPPRSRLKESSPFLFSPGARGLAWREAADELDDAAAAVPGLIRRVRVRGPAACCGEEPQREQRHLGWGSG
jgi:hypothetical protein